MTIRSRWIKIIGDHMLLIHQHEDHESMVLNKGRPVPRSKPERHKRDGKLHRIPKERQAEQLLHQKGPRQLHRRREQCVLSIRTTGTFLRNGPITRAMPRASPRAVKVIRASGIAKVECCCPCFGSRCDAGFACHSVVVTTPGIDVGIYVDVDLVCK